MNLLVDADQQFTSALACTHGRGVPQDYAEALEWLLLMAAEGDASAQFTIGSRYDNGEGVPLDIEEAAVWYRRAADQGNTDAQCCLAEMYAQGEGVLKNEAKALMWYEQAAEMRDSRAQNTLGAMYENGRGVQLDEEKAVHWYREAAAQGDAMAQNNLGAMYGNGQGTLPCSPSIAYALFCLSIKNGYDAAIGNLEKAKALLSGKQGIEASALSYMLTKPGLFLKTLDKANSDALLNWRAEENEKNVLAELIIAAEQGDTEAMCDLANEYEHGGRVPKNETEAASWYRQAAEHGNAHARSFLGEIYENGRGVQQSNAVAFAIYSLTLTESVPQEMPLLRLFKGISRESVEAKLSNSERQQAEQLVKELALPGNFLAALDAFLVDMDKQ